MKSSLLKDFLTLHPNGRVHVTRLFSHDKTGHKITSWGKEDFAFARENLKKYINAVKQKYGQNEKELRKILTKQRLDALNYFDKLSADILSKKNPRLIECINEWEETVTKEAMTPKAAQNLLDKLLMDDHMNIESSEVSRQILEAIERKKHKVENENEFPTIKGESYNRHKGTSESFTHQIMPIERAKILEERNIIQLQKEDLLPEELDGYIKAPDFDKKEYEATLKYQASLTDIDSDLLAFLFADFADKAKNPDDIVVVELNSIMATLHYHFNVSGSGGRSFRANDKQWIRERIKHLQNQYLTISRSHRSAINKRPVSISSTVLKIDAYIGQEDLAGRIPEWSGIRYGFGRAWSYRLFDNDYPRMVAIFQRGALKYHPEREKVEKRLLKRLSWYWRLNANKGNKNYCKGVNEIITTDIGAEFFPDKKEDAVRLEQALRTLKENGHIGGWRYTNGEVPIEKVETRLPNNWIGEWLSRDIEITMPQSLEIAYNKALGSPRTPKFVIEQDLPIGEKIKNFLTSADITAVAMAKDLGISKTAFSEIMNNKRASGKHTEPILKYIERKNLILGNYVKVIENIRNNT